MTKPVGIGQTDKGIPIVVCDDGSAWLYWQGENDWQEIAPVPGTAAAVTPEQAEAQMRRNLDVAKKGMGIDD